MVEDDAPLLMRATILVAVVAVLAALCAQTLSSEPPICPHDPHACYFSDGYSSARARFRAAALGANATLHTLSLPTGKDLTIDVAVLSSGTRRPKTRRRSSTSRARTASRRTPAPRCSWLSSRGG